MIHFVGAGPGAPDLITVRGAELLKQADVIIYAGSLVNPELLAYAGPECRVYNSAEMTLEEVLEVMENAEAAGKDLVRLHTGDMSLYGAIREQMDRLEEKGIAYDDTPGVSSFCGAAAALKAEYTLPGVSQSVVITRMEGRTPVPEREQLESLAKHRASMAIFLSVQNIGEVVRRLTTAYPDTTPVAVVQRATWPDQKIVQGTLADIEEKVKAADIHKTAQILVGDFLGDRYELSKLYDPSFSHEFRKAKE